MGSLATVAARNFLIILCIDSARTAKVKCETMTGELVQNAGEKRLLKEYVYPVKAACRALQSDIRLSSTAGKRLRLSTV